VNTYAVVFTPEAEQQLAELYGYIAATGALATALGYTAAILDYCAALTSFPYRGVLRDDIRPNLRLVNYKKNAVIAFAVDEAAATVTIVGIFYGGRNYPALLGP
jgi:plasmid stabilization system protein ParE